MYIIVLVHPQAVWYCEPHYDNGPGEGEEQADLPRPRGSEWNGRKIHDINCMTWSCLTTKFFYWQITCSKRSYMYIHVYVYVA